MREDVSAYMRVYGGGGGGSLVGDGGAPSATPGA